MWGHEGAIAGEVAEHAPQRTLVLGSQDLSRGDESRLPTSIDDLQHRSQRHESLTGADFSLQEPIHRVLLPSPRMRVSPRLADPP